MAAVASCPCMWRTHHIRNNNSNQAITNISPKSGMLAQNQKTPAPIQKHNSSKSEDHPSNRTKSEPTSEDVCQQKTETRGGHRKRLELMEIPTTFDEIWTVRLILPSDPESVKDQNLISPTSELETRIQCQNNNTNKEHPNSPKYKHQTSDQTISARHACSHACSHACVHACRQACNACMHACPMLENASINKH